MTYTKMNVEKVRVILLEHLKSFNIVKAYDNGGLTMDRYAIAIGKDLWFMSAYPAYPNGVCMYGGRCSDEYSGVHLGKPIALDELPIAVLEQVIVLAEEGI